MNSKELLHIRNKLKSVISHKAVIDVILFGSVLKGKATPRDIDIAIITETIFDIDIPGFHISFIKPSDFFSNPPALATTLL